MRSSTWQTFYCPNTEECGWSGSLRWIGDTLTDPGYLDGDPPEECPECGADMTECVVDSAAPEDDRDPVDEMFERADAAFDRDR